MWFMEEVGELSAALRRRRKASWPPSSPTCWPGWRRWPTSPASIWTRPCRPSTAAAAPAAAAARASATRRRNLVNNAEQQNAERRIASARCGTATGPEHTLASILHSAFCILHCLLPVACSLAARAESPPHIEKVQHRAARRHRGNRSRPRCRVGAWAPVYVELKAGPDGNVRDSSSVRVETTDSENTAYHYDTRAAGPRRQPGLRRRRLHPARRRRQRVHDPPRRPPTVRPSPASLPSPSTTDKRAARPQSAVLYRHGRRSAARLKPPAGRPARQRRRR